MASRRRSRSTRRARKHGKLFNVKVSLRKRHGGAKYGCLHPKSHRKSYHKKKSAAKRACGKGSR